jgi:hypothetical protein
MNRQVSPQLHRLDKATMPIQYDSKEAISLAHAFVPKFKFHSNEVFFPHSVQHFMAHSSPDVSCAKEIEHTSPRIIYPHARNGASIAELKNIPIYAVVSSPSPHSQVIEICYMLCFMYTGPRNACSGVFQETYQGPDLFSFSQQSGGLSFVTVRLMERMAKLHSNDAEVPVIVTSPSNYDLLEVFYSNGRGCGEGFWTTDIISSIPSVENVVENETSNPLVPLIYISMNAHGCYHRASVWQRWFGVDNDYTDELGHEWTPSRITVLRFSDSDLPTTCNSRQKLSNSPLDDDGTALHVFLTSTLRMSADCLPWHSCKYKEQTSL